MGAGGRGGAEGRSQAKAQGREPDGRHRGGPGSCTEGGSSCLTLHPGAEPLSPGGPLRQGHIWGGGQGGSVVGFSGQQCFPASNGGAQPIPGRRPLVMPRAVRASRGPANLCGLAASVSQVPRASVTDVQPCPRHMEGSGLVCALSSFPRIA